MGFLLVRHSDAANASGDVDDAARWLTAIGRAKAESVAHALKQRGIAFTRFVTSPRVRAVQTAEIFAHVLGFRGPVESLPSLSYTLPAQKAAADLRALDGHVAAFGHMPTLAETAQLLCNKPVAVALTPSEAIWIDGGRLLWVVDPQEALKGAPGV